MVKRANSEIMDIKEVAEYLHIHPATVYKYARAGKIPAFKIGYDWRFHKKLIDRWIINKVKYNSQYRKER